MVDLLALAVVDAEEVSCDILEELGLPGRTAVDIGSGDETETVTEVGCAVG